MKASETKFQHLIEGTKQYIVPLFQRAYSWDKKEWDVLWDVLWDDLMDLCDNTNKNHFIGSIVTMQDKSVPEGVTKYLLIDGQQRLTTIFILLALIRDLAKNNGDEELSNEINQVMLVNPFKKDDDYFKLMPTQVDRNLFKKLIRQEPLSDQSQLYNCYQFFDRKIRKESVKIQALKEVIINRLSVVSIVLDNDDNPHLVFESLNAKGRVLTQSDLIRNYFFMRISVDKQDEIYEEYWEPMQRELGGNLTESIRHYLMRNGTMVKKTEVYFTLKEQIEQNDALDSLKDITVFANYYKKLLRPEKETNIAINNALKRINKLEVTTAYPFLLNCYNDYCTEQISADDFAKILNIIENFIIRRFVCNRPTNQLNKIFPSLYGQAKDENSINLADGVCKILQKRNYPSDVEFRERLKNSRLYGYGDRAVKAKLILETLETAYQHKEKTSFDNLSIEHIMPQKLTDWWQNHLGENWVADHDMYLHTLGNLTLTAYNAELSNDTFPQKQKHFIEKSHLELNSYFKDVERWTRLEIEKRSEALSDIALGVWPYFGDNQLTQINNEGVTGKKPKILTFNGYQFIVNSWREVLEKTLFEIYDVQEDSEFLSILAKEYPDFISSNPNQLRQPQQLYQNSDYYFETKLLPKQIYNFCIKAIESIGWSAEEWKVETD
jgi:uncharacterized protein with ParB-like and HNH nuclease domain